MTSHFDWKISEHRFEAGTIPQTIETQLDEVIDEDSERRGTRTIWETESSSLCKTEVILDVETGEIEVSGYSTHRVKRVTQVLLAAVPFIIVGTLVWNPVVLLAAAIPVYAGVPFLLVYNHTSVTEPLATYTTTTRWKLTPYIFACVAGLLGIIVAVMVSIDIVLTAVLIFGITAFLGLTALVAQALRTDAGTVDASAQLFFLLQGLKVVLLPFSLLMGIYSIPVDQETVELLQAVAGVIAQSTSGVVLGSVVFTGLVFVPALLKPRYSWTMAFALPIAAIMTYTGHGAAYGYYVLPVLAVFATGYVLRSIFSNNVNVLHQLEGRHLPTFQSPVTRYTILGVYIAANLLILAVIGVVLLVLIPGTAVPASMLPVSAARVETVMALLAVVFKPWPLFAPATYRAALLLLLAAPLIGFVAAWLYNVVSIVVAKVVLLKRTAPSSYDSDVVPDAVQLRRVPGETPDVRPVTMLFGVKQFIVVGEALFNELSEEELDAVLAHEAYHLRHRDWTANLVASVLAGLFGGKNALLVFYEYPRVEQEADRHAVEQVGRTPLIQALRTVELLWKRTMKGGGNALHHAYPGFTRGPEDENNGIMQEVRALYAVCFGSVLLDAAHRDIEERIAWIKEMDRSSD